jgi:hypothetical protein
MKFLIAGTVLAVIATAVILYGFFHRHDGQPIDGLTTDGTGLLEEPKTGVMRLDPEKTKPTPGVEFAKDPVFRHNGKVIPSAMANAGMALKLDPLGPKLLELHRPWVRIGNNLLVELSAEEFAKIAAAYVVENKDGKNALVIYGPPPAPASTP